MPRPPASVLWLATFASGIALGLAISPRGLILSARSSPNASANPSEPAISKGGDQDALYKELAQSYEHFRPVDRAFELVSRVVSPAVVHIMARKVGTRDDGDVGRIEESGSGVIVRGDGGKGLFVLTNNHVVERASASDITIVLHDGQTLKPSQFWADTKADVAVLKIDRDELPSAHLGDSDDARVGTWVVALGSPFGLTHSVSQGIISARGRYEQELEIDGVEHQEFLQTDAAINPGNSGGPLVNLKGEVIGLNTAIASEGGGSEGVGFSIPINLARWAMTQLIANGRVSRGAIGVNLQELTPRSALELGLLRPRGARVALVHEGSPAARAGLVADDVVLQFNGTEVTDDNHLINLVSVSPIGRESDLVIWRGKRSLPIRVLIADRESILSKSKTPPSVVSADVPTGRKPRATSRGTDLGVSMSVLDDATKERLFGPVSGLSGLLVTRVDPSSPLAGALKALDVIETIASSPATSPESALRLLRRPPGSSPLVIGLRRMEQGSLEKKSLRIP